MPKARDDVVGTEEENPRGDAAGVKARGEQRAFEAAGEGASTHDAERGDLKGAATARPGDPKMEAGVNALLRRVMQQMPSDAVLGGTFAPEEGQPLHEFEAADVPDGKYRVQGSDWILEIEGGKFKGSYKALPPDFGGPDVVSVRAS